MNPFNCLNSDAIKLNGLSYVERVKVVEVGPGRKPPTTRIDNKRFSTLNLRQTDTAHDVGTRRVGNAVRLPVMVGVTVRDDDMSNRGPLFFRDQAPEGKDPEILAWIYCDSCVALFDKKCVVQVMSDFHGHYPTVILGYRRNPSIMGCTDGG
jgi:hypothetical protein